MEEDYKLPDYTIDFEKVSRTESLLEITRRTARNILKRPYTTIGQFLKGLSEEDLYTLCDIIDDEEDPLIYQDINPHALAASRLTLDANSGGGAGALSVARRSFYAICSDACAAPQSTSLFSILRALARFQPQSLSSCACHVTLTRAHRYVPSSDEELKESLISASWAGGRQVAIDWGLDVLWFQLEQI